MRTSDTSSSSTATEGLACERVSFSGGGIFLGGKDRRGAYAFHAELIPWIARRLRVPEAEVKNIGGYRRGAVRRALAVIELGELVWRYEGRPGNRVIDNPGEANHASE